MFNVLVTQECLSYFSTKHKYVIYRITVLVNSAKPMGTVGNDMRMKKGERKEVRMELAIQIAALNIPKSYRGDDDRTILFGNPTLGMLFIHYVLHRSSYNVLS